MDTVGGAVGEAACVAEMAWCAAGVSADSASADVAKAILARSKDVVIMASSPLVLLAAGCCGVVPVPCG
ncbi:hypothetical protein A7R75_23150 [Mycolicibacterium llatzerense]|nr:hypothetical protein [Mycolicibacterium llatzerense]